jgi:hypothetical protein
MADEKLTKRLRFEAEPHHTLEYEDGKPAVHGGEEFHVDGETFAWLMAAPYVHVVDVSDSTPEPAPAPPAKPTRTRAADTTKED